MASPTGTKVTQKPQRPKRKFKVVQAKVETKAKETLTPSEKAYFAALHAFVDVIYARAANELQWTWNELAGKSGVSYVTVDRLGNRETRYPRYHTIWKLATAVGLDITSVEAKRPKNKPKVVTA